MSDPFKPSMAFLRKVAGGGVMKVRGYSSRKGGYTKIIGGERLLDRHVEAELVTPPYVADLGRPSYASLTPKGEALLASVDTHPKGGDGEAAPFMSGAVPKADAPPPEQPSPTPKESGQ